MWNIITFLSLFILVLYGNTGDISKFHPTVDFEVAIIYAFEEEFYCPCCKCKTLKY